MFLDMVLEEVSERLNDTGIAIIPSSAELTFRLKQKFTDFKHVKGNGHTIVYLSNVIDLPYYHELVNKIAPDRNIDESKLLLLLTDFVKRAFEKNTSIEEQIREFFE